jgi:hypothetical protein
LFQDARAAQRAAMQAEKLREDEKRRQFSFEIAKEQQVGGFILFKHFTKLAMF